MARITIDESLFNDERFINLEKKLKSSAEALGLYTIILFIAQKHWINHRSIPKESIDVSSKYIEVLVEVKLAERLPNGNIYIVGSKRAFEFLDKWKEKKEAQRTSKVSELP